MANVRLVFVVIAIILFIVAAFGVTSRINLMAAGLAFFAAASLSV